MDLTPDEIRSWLREILAQHNMNVTKLAKKAGVAHTTLSRFLNGQGMLSFGTAGKISKAAGVPLPIHNTAEYKSFFENEGEPFDYEKAEPSFKLAIGALLRHRDGADLWILQSEAIEDAGYLPGDLLIVDLNATPEKGDVVCAQVYDWRKGTAETVFRLYEPPYLLTASRNTRSRKPFVVNNEDVIIKGVVTDLLRTKMDSSAAHK